MTISIFLFENLSAMKLEKPEQKFFCVKDSLHAALFIEAVQGLANTKIRTAREVLQENPTASREDFDRYHAIAYGKTNKEDLKRERDRTFEKISLVTVFKQRAHKLIAKFEMDIKEYWATCASSVERIDFYQARFHELFEKLYLLKLECEPVQEVWTVQRADGTVMKTSDFEKKLRLDEKRKKREEWWALEMACDCNWYPCEHRGYEDLE